MRQDSKCLTLAKLLIFNYIPQVQLPLAPNNAFFDTSFTMSREEIEVGCCFPNKTVTKVTCGRGASCSGQCSAVEVEKKAKKYRKKKNSATQASLCPSSNCTGDPEDCRLEPLMEQGVENSLRCDACQGGSAVRWCWNECPVDVNHECCYNPGCYRKMKAECWWRDYMTGAFRPKVVSSFLLDPFSLTIMRLPCPQLSIR